MKIGNQNLFIESVVLGLPIPYIFVADISESEDLAGLEIIDGTQRIRTLTRFINNELRLKNLEKLKTLNGSASFNKKRLFSGNVDAREIKDTANMYGFSYKTNARKTQKGSDFLTVKTNRNDLAHGSKSFEEVGRNATGYELLKIQKRVISYLKAILENIESYLSNKEYLK